MLGNGFYKPRSLKAGTPAAGEVYPITKFCFATEIRGLEKIILGNKDEPQGVEEIGQN